MPRTTISLLAVAAAALLAGPLPAHAERDPATARLFATQCGWCHENGGRTASVKGPRLAGIMRSDAYIIDLIRFGKPGYMPAFADTLTRRQIHAILRYIHSLNDG